MEMITTDTWCESRPLSSVATIERNSIAPADIETGTFYVGLEHVLSDGGLTGVMAVENGTLASTKFRFSARHILYGKLRPYLSKIARPGFEGICSTDILPILPGPEINRNYLYYYLRQPHLVELATRRSSGANLPRLSPGQLADFPVALPPLSEQKRIAAILDQADTIRRRRRQAIETTAELTPSVFHAMFGSGHDVDRYEICELGAHAEVVSGVTKGRRFNGRPTMMLPYLRVANVQDGRLDLSEIKTVEALPSDLEKLRLEPGDVLLTEGGDHDKLGRGALWDGQIEDCIHQNHIFRVRVDRRRLTPVFFAQFLRTPFAKSYFLRCAKKTTNLATINMRQLRAFPVPLPPITRQERFVAKVRAASDLTTSLEHSLEASDAIFASLVQRAFRGEL